MTLNACLCSYCGETFNLLLGHTCGPHTSCRICGVQFYEGLCLCNYPRPDWWEYREAVG